MEMRPSAARANVRRYGGALLAATAALFLRGLLAPVFGEQNPYHTAWASVVFSGMVLRSGSFDSCGSRQPARNLVLVSAADRVVESRAPER